MPHTAQDLYKSNQPARPAAPLPERRPVAVVTIEPTTVAGLSEVSGEERNDMAAMKAEAGFPMIDLQAERQKRLSEQQAQSVTKDNILTVGAQPNPVVFELKSQAEGQLWQEGAEGDAEVAEPALSSENEAAPVLDTLRQAGLGEGQPVNFDELDPSHPLSNKNPENIAREHMMGEGESQSAAEVEEQLQAVYEGGGRAESLEQVRQAVAEKYQPTTKPVAGRHASWSQEVVNLMWPGGMTEAEMAAAIFEDRAEAMREDEAA